jgi:hypothetical protein
MQNTKIKQGQSLFDATIETTGDVENVFSTALSNGVGITDDVEVLSSVKIEGSIKPPITGLFGRTHSPATSIAPNNSLGESNAGIGYWILEVDFQVK